VGLVWVAWVHRSQPPQARAFQFGGAREQVRSQAADAALAGLLDRLTS
jgi:nicotinamide mononucleotide (NMN) deamidase PncC